MIRNRKSLQAKELLCTISPNKFTKYTFYYNTMYIL